MSQRYYNLYSQIYTFSNLWLAFDKAAKGKHSRPSVAKLLGGWIKVVAD